MCKRSFSNLDFFQATVQQCKMPDGDEINSLELNSTEAGRFHSFSSLCNLQISCSCPGTIVKSYLYFTNTSFIFFHFFIRKLFKMPTMQEQPKYPFFWIHAHPSMEGTRYTTPVSQSSRVLLCMRKMTPFLRRVTGKT